MNTHFWSSREHARRRLVMCKQGVACGKAELWSSHRLRCSNSCALPADSAEHKHIYIYIYNLSLSLYIYIYIYIYMADPIPVNFRWNSGEILEERVTQQEARNKHIAQPSHSGQRKKRGGQWEEHTNIYIYISIYLSMCIYIYIYDYMHIYIYMINHIYI